MHAVVLTYGREQQHLPLLEELAAQGVDPAGCLVVHNPTEPGEAWRPAVPDGVRLVVMPRNGGYTAGMNRGIAEQRAAGAELVLLLTHDARLEPGAVAALAEAADRHREAGVLGVVLDRGPDGLSYGGAQFGDGHVGHLAEPPPAADGVADVPWVDGSALAVRTAALGAAAPLEEGFFMYFDDAWLCSSVRARGHRVVVVLAARARSASGWSSRPGAHAYLMTRNGLEWAWRKEGRRAAARLAAYELWKMWDLFPKPGGERWRDPARRRTGIAVVEGRLLGMLAWIGRRWGPPPPRLQRRGDIAGT